MLRVSRLKVTYQRNMLIGQGVVITLSLIFALLIRHTYSGHTGSERMVRLNLSNLPITSLFSSDPDDGNQRQEGGSLGGRTYQFGTNPVIIDDSTEVTRIWRARFPSYGPITGPDEGFGDGPSYGYQGNESSGGDTIGYLSEFEPSVDRLNRSVGMISARKPDYPLIALERRMQGEVELLLYIDSNGQMAQFPLEMYGRTAQLVDHLLLKEEPTSWFFATKTLEVIKDWQFYPAVENGKVVSSFLKVHVKFVLGSSGAWLMLESQERR